MSGELDKLQHELEAAQRALAEAEARYVHLNAEHQRAAQKFENSCKDIEQAHQEWISALDVVEDPIFMHDRDFRILRCNLAYQRCAGLPYAQIIGQPYYEIFPKTHAPLGNCLRALEETAKAGDEEEVVVGDITYRSRAHIVNDVQGTYLYSVHILEDISKRKAAEAGLKLFHTLLDKSNDAIEVLDPVTLRFIDVNKTACRTLGYSRDELLLMRIHDIDPVIDELQLKKINDMLQVQHSIVFEARHHRKDGSSFPVEISISQVWIDREYRVAVVRDISERKLAETDLRISDAAFEAQESQMITDADGVILRINNAFAESTGYTSGEAVGQTPRLLKSDRHDANFYRVMWETIQHTGTWQGEVWNRRKNGEIYPVLLTISAINRDDGLVTNYIGSYIDLTKHKEAEKTISTMAFNDLLTGLPNRRLLLDRLHKAFASSLRSGREGALLYIDLDNFKDINDTLGHDMGNLLLQQVAQRLVSCIRVGDTVARLGSDEFVVLLEDLSQQHIEAATQADTVGEQILATLRQPYQLETHEYHNTPSIGITLFSDHGKSAEELLKRADIAMYQAKMAGRNPLKFFNQDMQDAISARIALENGLHKALEEHQFALYYQIQVDDSHRAFGAEALIRWMHPERGIVSPAEFIPLAEETGLILPIGQWVLETACAQLKAWEHDALTRNLVLAVNVSARQFHQIDFAAQVQSLIQRYAINPNLLKLELTESMLADDIENTIATMNALKAMSVRFSLDDFGTGYSSLQYLKRLPLDQLKIDQSFVHDLADSNDKAIVRTIIAMAKSLSLNVIAEGVETEAQRQLLLGKGCTYFQGYLFGKPVPIEQFNALLKQG